MVKYSQVYNLICQAFPFFLKTGITSACFKQWGYSPLTRDWLKFWNINLEKMPSFIFTSFTDISPSGQAFLILRLLIISFTLSIEAGWKLKEEIFFDFVMLLIFVILGWYWYLTDAFFYRILDASCFLYITLILYCVDLWRNFHQNIP